MRIALLSWESLHSIAEGGVAAHVSELGAALAEAGHEVHVLTRMGPGQGDYDSIDGVHYHRCAYGGHPDFVEDVNNMCRSMVGRLFAVEDGIGRFDLVHAHDWLTANAMIWAKQGRGHKTVMTIHSTEYGRCGNAFAGSARITAQERAGCDWADHVIAVSATTRAEAAWMYEVPEWKSSVIYNGVHPERFDRTVDPGAVRESLGIGPMDPMILFCGRLAWQKGPDLLVEALPWVLDAFPHAKCVFAGEGSMRPQLEGRAGELGVAHACRFLGKQGPDRLVELFRAADAACVPSRNEPFGIVVLEAWSAETPVVVTQVGGPREYVTPERDGYQIQPHPESVAWGLGTLLADFEHARAMGRAGRETVERHFTWETIAAETLDVYDPFRYDEAASVPVDRQLPEQPAEQSATRAEQAVAELELAGSLDAATLSDCATRLSDGPVRVRRSSRGLELVGPWDEVRRAVAWCQRALSASSAAGTSPLAARLVPASEHEWGARAVPDA